MTTPRVFHPVLNTSMVHVRFSIGTNQCENTYAYHWLGTNPTAAQLLSLATEVWSTIGVKTQNLLHQSGNFREVYARNINVPIAAQATYAVPQPAPGARGGSAVAANEAANLVTRTGLTGRTNHGAKRYSGFAEGDVDGNSLGTFIINQLISIALSVLASRVGGQFTPAIASVVNGTSTPITQALSLDNNVDSQKTRLNAHGR